MEFKLYRTKLKLSSLLTSSTTQPVSYLVLAAPNKDSIWFNRTNGDVSWQKIQNLNDLEEISTVYGFIGKFQINSSIAAKLIFIKQIESVDKLKAKSIEHQIYKIKKILIVSLVPNGSDDGSESFSSVDCDLIQQQLAETQQPITIRKSASVAAMSDVADTRFERKLCDEIYKVFQENDGSFYFSLTFDLTNSIERQEEQIENKSFSTKHLWRNADDRFFWNKTLLSDLIEIAEQQQSSDDGQLSPFILPIVQGFVEIAKFKDLFPNLTKDSMSSLDKLAELRMCLISRRSRYRLGTRFKRRGIDENGNVANFVETEQIIDVYDGHTLSFVIVRGSIPIYWSQPGLKYRPAPQIDKSFIENKLACVKHFEQLKSKYSSQNQIVIINLAEEFGRESLLGDAFIEQVAGLSSNYINYVHFDFHEYCKGLNYNNISILTEKIKDFIEDKFYCWVDNRGFIHRQKSLFRINCVDCLDRTNVIQTVISKIALENQLARLGFFIPPVKLPNELNKCVSILWADNGDAISQQYAGTDALKGDFTRTGERSLLHAVKDGMKSANRYYLRFKDNYRQLAFEVLQGNRVSDIDSTKQMSSNAKTDDLNTGTAVTPSVDEISQNEREENVKQLISDCKKQLVDNNEDCYGSWGLINYSETADPNQLDPDVFLLFTSSALYVSNYDETQETLIDYQKILLKDVERLELSPDYERKQFRFYVLRLYYKIPIENGAVSETEPGQNEANEEKQNGYFHMFRSCNLRFFNNLVITTNSSEQLTEALRGICHTIQSTASHFNHNIEYEETNKLIKKKSKTPQNFIRLSRFHTRLSIDFELQNIGQSNNKDSLVKKWNKLINNSLNNMSSKLKLLPETLQIQNGGQSNAAHDTTGDSIETGSIQLESFNKVDSYLPKLSQKNFLNKEAKLNFISKFIINESKSKFLFI